MLSRVIHLIEIFETQTRENVAFLPIFYAECLRKGVSQSFGHASPGACVLLLAFVDFALFHNENHILKQRHIFEWVTRHRNDIG